MRLYGFPPNILFGIVGTKAAIPQVLTDGTYQYDYNYNTPYTYDEADPIGNLGCPALIIPCTQADLQVNNFPNWLSTTNNKLDLRGIYSSCNSNGFYDPLFSFPSDVLSTYSSISGHNVAYTTESIFYAQSAYFVTVVMVQWSNVFACKSRKVSLIYSGINKHMFLGVLA